MTSRYRNGAWSLAACTRLSGMCSQGGHAVPGSRTTTSPITMQATSPGTLKIPSSGALLRGRVGPVEVRNQARVHIWFQDRFGFAYPRLASTDQALGYYASVVHSVGVRLESDGRLNFVAPFGFDDMFELVVRPNYALPNGASHDSKAARAKAIWPEVTVVRWQTDQGHSPAVGPGSIFPAAEDDAGNILKGFRAP